MGLKPSLKPSARSWYWTRSMPGLSVLPSIANRNDFARRDLKRKALFGGPVSVSGRGRLARWKRAIRQVGNLRYGDDTCRRVFCLLFYVSVIPATPRLLMSHVR